MAGQSKKALIASLVFLVLIASSVSSQDFGLGVGMNRLKAVSDVGAGVDNLLLETGDNVLLEMGPPDTLLLE